MGWRLIRAVRGGLEVGRFDAETLRRWFRRLDEIKEESPDDFDQLRTAAELQLNVMRAMSVNLPTQPVYLSRIRPFGTNKLDCSHVEKMRRSCSYGEPIVVMDNLDGGPLELADGRHRVTAARLNGVRTLRAVRAGSL